MLKTLGHSRKASLHGVLSGWVRNNQLASASLSSLLSHQWPWQWTYAVMLERRWEQMQELSTWDDDGNPPPKEWWHDTKRVDDWVDERREARRKKYDRE